MNRQLAQSPSIPTAYRYVRQLLSERPRHFQELLSDGIALHLAENPQQQITAPASSSSVASSSSTTLDDVAAPATATAAAPKKRSRSPGLGMTALRGSLAPVEEEVVGKVKGSEAAERRADGSSVLSKLPEGHPWVSGSYLKSRVLARLESQNLIYKKAVRVPSSNRPVFHWHLRPTDTTVTLPTPALPPWSTAPPPEAKTWSTPDHWDRLLSADTPEASRAISEDLKAFREARAEATREKRISEGKEKRRERDIWVWEGRVEGKTSVNQRTHLSIRRRKNRTSKEVERIRERREYESGELEEGEGTVAQEA